MRLNSILFLLLAAFHGAMAISSFSPARPPALPLAVKSPYLSTWLNAGSDGGNGGYLPGQWPVHWSNHIVGWTGLIRVDGVTYTWMGAPDANTNYVNQSSYIYTSTKSIFSMDVAGKVEMNITFLSPIAPEDFKRQSLVFSYLDVQVNSVDGAEHDVQLYTDITAEWVSGDRNAVAAWDFGTTGDVAYHKVFRQTQLAWSEVDDQTEFGNWYWATDNDDAVTHQSGSDIDVRNAFTTSGKLANSADNNFRPIQQDWPVFGFAKELGKVGAEQAGARFSIGLCQDEPLQFLGADGYKPLPSLWKSFFANDLEALGFFHGDYDEANRISSGLDDKIRTDSLATGGADLLTVTSLSARQAFAATQLVGTQDKTYLFLKEVSSNGNMQTIDVIFPAHPIYLYTNPTLIKLLLDPHFENQESGHYPNAWAIHDLGAHFPNATGHPTGDDEPMPVEECGNNLIMMLAYAQRSGDNDYLNQHYPILQQWTQFLVNDSLIPFNQLSTDDFAGELANQTNLALKGIIGIQAMSEIARLTGREEDATRYSDTAHSYIDQWQTLGIAYGENPPHTTLSYNNNETHGLLYNLYADSELGLNLVPQEVYDMQSSFYPSVKDTFGVALDTRHSWTKGDWEIWAAAISSKSTQSMFYQELASWVSQTPTSRPLTDLYDVKTGDYPENDIFFVARPVMGGSFAQLILPEGARVAQKP